MARRARKPGGMEKFKDTYFSECSERIATVEEILALLNNGADATDETLNELFRAVHSIKGGAGAFGFEAISALSHTFENVLDALRSHGLDLNAEVLDVLVIASDTLASTIERSRDGKPPPANWGSAEKRLLQDLLTPSSPLDTTEPAATAGEPEPEGHEPEPERERGVRIHFVPKPDLFKTANDPLLIVRELKTLGNLLVGVDTEKLPALDTMDPELCYLGWTFDLETDRSEEDIREVFEFVEDDCDLEIVFTDSPAAKPEPEEPQATKPAPPVATPVATPVSTAQPSVADEPTGKSPAPRQTLIRVDLDRVDKLVNMVGELVITQAVLEQHLSGVRIEDETTVRGLEALSSHMREMQESVMAIRMQPVQSVFARMPRLVRELARSLGKNVQLVTSGETTEVDKTVIENLSDPLTHMIRNALDHGIEPPEERVRLGKPEKATIHLSAAHRSGRIAIEVTDDGRGINREKVLARAVERGLVQRDADLSDEDVSDLIFSPGFSTAQDLTDVSGRGVGMDVVRRAVQEIGGRVLVNSREGQGTRFVLSLPLTLAVMDGMIVKVGAEQFVMPLGCIIESVRPGDEDLSKIASLEQLVRYRGDYVPLVYLHRLFRVPDAIEDCRRALVVFVETDIGTVIGIVVDDLLGERQVVIKSLEENFRPVDGVSAATILGDGRVALILEVNGLHAMYRALDLPQRRPDREPEAKGDAIP
jgi:two-component system, chemotaxis family, sensor kinase CheA